VVKSPVCVFYCYTNSSDCVFSFPVSTLILIPTNSILIRIILMEIKESNEFLLGVESDLKTVMPGTGLGINTSRRGKRILYNLYYENSITN